MTINNETQEQIITFLKNCDFRSLVDIYFADDFLWIIKGSSILSGTYTNKDIFYAQVIKRLSNVLQADWRMHILEIYVAGNTLIVEMRGEVKAKNGQDYNNEYCWIFKFNDNNKIVSITAYYDSLLVNKTLAENETTVNT